MKILRYSVCVMLFCTMTSGQRLPYQRDILPAFMLKNITRVIFLVKKFAQCQEKS